MRFRPSEHSFGTEQFPQTKPAGGALGLGLPLLAAAAIVPTFGIYPLVIKAFKPELSYWRRVGIGMGITFALGAVTGIVKAAKK